MIRTKIICTIGPSVDSDKAIVSMLNSNMALIRINCSHSNPETWMKHLQRVRRIEKKLKRPIGVMVDLQGPKLRVGDLPEPFTLRGDEIWKMSPTLTADAKQKTIRVGFKGLAKAVHIGQSLYMDDGIIRADVTKILGDTVWVRVVHGGLLESRKGINIPYHKGKLPVLSHKDLSDLKWSLEQKVDFVALSFVRRAEDILKLKRLIQKFSKDHQPLVIAKIEKPEAVDNMQSIIEASDGILIARGDLGIELSPFKVPVVQKQIIESCRKLRKPVIVATQMLDSMRRNPIPTRAEASDVASAIFAGADAVLLTGETSSGNFPLEATTMMRDIILEVENHMIRKRFHKTPRDFGLSQMSDHFMFNVMQMAEDVAANAIVMLTRHGNLTRLLSKLHPKQPIFSLALNTSAYRQLTLFWGVFPIEMPAFAKSSESRLNLGIKILRRLKKDIGGSRILFVYRDYKSVNLNLKVVDL